MDPTIPGGQAGCRSSRRGTATGSSPRAIRASRAQWRPAANSSTRGAPAPAMLARSASRSGPASSRRTSSAPATPGGKSASASERILTRDGPRSGIERHRQRPEAPQDRVRAELDAVAREAQRREPGEERRERHLGLEPRERGPEAEVGAEAEREGAGLGAGEVEAVRVREGQRIAVCGANPADDEGAPADRVAAELRILRRDANGGLHG